jgi:hypothetical protein
MGERRNAFTPTQTLPHQGGGQVLGTQADTIPPPVSHRGGGNLLAQLIDQ